MDKADKGRPVMSWVPLLASKGHTIRGRSERLRTPQTPPLSQERADIHLTPPSVADGFPWIFILPGEGQQCPVARGHPQTVIGEICTGTVRQAGRLQEGRNGIWCYCSFLFYKIRKRPGHSQQVEEPSLKPGSLALDSRLHFEMQG